MKHLRTNKAMCLAPAIFLAGGIGVYAFNMSYAIYYMFYVATVFAVLSIKFGVIGSLIGGVLSLIVNISINKLGFIEGHYGVLNSWVVLNVVSCAISAILHKEISNEIIIKEMLEKRINKEHVTLVPVDKQVIGIESLESLRRDLYNIAISLMKFKTYQSVIKIKEVEKLQLKIENDSSREECVQAKENSGYDCDDEIFSDEDMAMIRTDNND